MSPSERVSLIAEIAQNLGATDWPLIDLTLRQFDLPTSDVWQGQRYDYVIAMIEQASDSKLVSLAEHLKLRSSSTQVHMSVDDLKILIRKVNAQKALMIDVATGGTRIQIVNQEYEDRRVDIQLSLKKLGIDDPNLFPDLWAWYSKWSDGSLPSYQSRRDYVNTLYQPLLDQLIIGTKQAGVITLDEPTGWPRVDRNISTIVSVLEAAKNEEDFQSVGLLCREAIISTAQAVFDPTIHSSIDGTTPSETDAKRMIEAYLAHELAGKSNEDHRRYAKAVYQLAVAVQHKRTANFRDAALCAEATKALVNVVAIISGRRDPES